MDREGKFDHVVCKERRKVHVDVKLMLKSLTGKIFCWYLYIEDTSINYGKYELFSPAYKLK